MQEHVPEENVEVDGQKAHDAVVYRTVLVGQLHVPFEVKYASIILEH